MCLLNMYYCMWWLVVLLINYPYVVYLLLNFHFKKKMFWIPNVELGFNLWINMDCRIIYLLLFGFALAKVIHNFLLLNYFTFPWVYACQHDMICPSCVTWNSLETFYIVILFEEKASDLWSGYVGIACTFLWSEDRPH